MASLVREFMNSVNSTALCFLKEKIAAGKKDFAPSTCPKIRLGGRACAVKLSCGQNVGFGYGIGISKGKQ